LRRNRVSLDWADAWTLRGPAVDLRGAELIDTSVRFVQRMLIRLTRLPAVGRGVSRSEVERLVADGTISSVHRLTGRRLRLHRARHGHPPRVTTSQASSVTVTRWTRFRDH
jgi:hypothetical protein